jgi:hypothetical protein
MKISVRQAYHTLQSIFRLQYYLPNGQQKAMEVAVNDYGDESNCYRQRVLGEMVQKARGDIMAQFNDATTAANASYGRPAWYKYATYGGTASTATAVYATGDNDMYLPDEPNPTYWQQTVLCSTPTEGKLPESFSRKKIIFMDGKRRLEIWKDDNGGELVITPEDMQQARVDYFKGLRLQIITKRAEHKAEDLLKMFISEVDFRHYKERGFFLVKSGNKVYRIHKDSHKWIDMYEQQDSGLIVPKNRLCVHTATRDLPLADEALSKLMLIKSNKVIEHSNLHAIDSKPINRLADLLEPVKDDNCVCTPVMAQL